jgi:hypothetical protein
MRMLHRIGLAWMIGSVWLITVKAGVASVIFMVAGLVLLMLPQD